MQLVKTDYDKTTGITEEFWYNHLADEVTIKRLQDTDSQLDMNKEMFNAHNRANYDDSNGVHLVARIPIILVEQWQRDGFDWYQSTDKERRAWLDKPEHAFLKVRPGKLDGVTPNKLSSKVN